MAASYEEDTLCINYSDLPIQLKTSINRKGIPASYEGDTLCTLHSLYKLIIMFYYVIAGVTT